MTEKDTPLPPSGGSWIHDPVTGTLVRALDGAPEVTPAAEPLQPVEGDRSSAPTKEKSK